MEGGHESVGRHRRSWWGAGAVAIAGLLVGCALVGGAGLWLAARSSPFGGRAQPTPTSAQIESVARITLPPSVRGVRAHQEGFMDRIIWVRFEMAPADLGPFVAGTRVPPPLSSATNPFAGGIGSKLPGWTPEEAQRFEAGEASAGGVGQAILIDTTDQQRYVVYVRTFEM